MKKEKSTTPTLRRPPPQQPLSGLHRRSQSPGRHTYDWTKCLGLLLSFYSLPNLALHFIFIFPTHKMLWKHLTVKYSSSNIVNERYYLFSSSLQKTKQNLDIANLRHLSSLFQNETVCQYSLVPSSGTFIENN